MMDPANSHTAAIYFDQGDLTVKQISLLNVLVKDQDAAIEFYKKLGFAVMERLP